MIYNLQQEYARPDSHCDMRPSLIDN